MDYLSSYKLLYEKGKLTELAKTLKEKLQSCRLCPRNCGVNRLEGETGFCRTGKLAKVASFSAHFGEESPLVGSHGSGTIFFSYCNLGCLYCQNYKISRLGQGEETSPKDLARIMLRLQETGCHNINFVTPTHIIPQILEALPIAIEEGLSVPLVYNTGGYDSVNTLKLIEGVFDIYMPDTKYSSRETADKYSQAPDYWQVNKACLTVMQQQAGDLIINEQQVAQRGLLIRHLVLPNNLSGSFEILRFIRDRLSKNAYVNIMDQYRPCFNAHKYPELSRSMTTKEYQAVIDLAKQIGLYRGF
ncbi:MAG: radical SAM protein [Desulfobacteraceae bacterium]|nr:radical SAM protein [Desulfobacteraceae bacterium]